MTFSSFSAFPPPFLPYPDEEYSQYLYFLCFVISTDAFCFCCSLQVLSLGPYEISYYDFSFEGNLNYSETFLVKVGFCGLIYRLK